MAKDITVLVLAVLCLFSVFVVILALQGMPDQSAEWTVISQNLAPFILLILAVGIVGGIVVTR